MAFQNSERSDNTIGADFRAMAGAFVIHEPHKHAGAKRHALQIGGIPDQYSKSAFLNFLQIRHWSMFGMVSCVVQIFGLVGIHLLSDRVQRTFFNHRGIDFDLNNARQFFGRTVAANDANFQL